MINISPLKSTRVSTAAQLWPDAHKSTIWIYFGFLFYVVAPIYDNPFWGGLSISAPLEFLLFGQLFLKSGQGSYRIPGKWVAFLYCLWMGMAISTFANVVFNSIEANNQQIILLVRYVYWYIVFITIQQITSNKYLAKITTIVLGLSVIALAAIRITEAFMVVGWSAYDTAQLPSLLTKNLYGLQFSTFMFFAVALPFLLKSIWRWTLVLGVGILAIAILGNGSRGGWIGLTVGGMVFLLMYTLSRPTKRVWVLVIPPIAYFFVFVIPLPGTLGHVVNYQIKTLYEVDKDPSYAFRQYMANKGIYMFKESPIIGAGLGEFIGTTVEGLPVPEPLRPRLQRIKPYFTTNSAHNAYVLLLAETGLVGTVPFALLVLYLGIKGFFAAMKLARHDEIWGIAVYCSFIAMNIHFWALTGLGSTGPWLIYGFVAGMIQAASNLKDDPPTRIIPARVQ